MYSTAMLTQISYRSPLIFSRALRAALIELFIDGSSTNRHFHNLAHWYGRIYKGIPISNPINVSQMIAEVIEVINRIDMESY